MAVTSFYLVCGITTNQFVDEDNSVECSCSSQLSDRRQSADEWSKKRGVNFLLGKENLISGSGSFWILATKAQSHEVTPSILSDIFVPWCLCGLFV